MNPHEYPTLAVLQSASLETLSDWFENLPPPQTDVQHTIQRRLRKLIDEAVRRQDPKVADSIDKLREACERVGIKIPGNIFTKG